MVSVAACAEPKLVQITGIAQNHQCIRLDRGFRLWPLRCGDVDRRTCRREKAPRTTAPPPANSGLRTSWWLTRCHTPYLSISRPASISKQAKTRSGHTARLFVIVVPPTFVSDRPTSLTVMLLPLKGGGFPPLRPSVGSELLVIVSCVSCGTSGPQSDRACAMLSGTDAHHVIHLVDKNLAIAGIAGVGVPLDGLHNLLGHFVGDDYFQF